MLHCSDGDWTRRRLWYDASILTASLLGADLEKDLEDWQMRILGLQMAKEIASGSLRKEWMVGEEVPSPYSQERPVQYLLFSVQ